MASAKPSRRSAFRPQTAQGKIQSHPKIYSSLYEDRKTGRPITSQSAPGSVHPLTPASAKTRPTTHTSGPKYISRSVYEDPFEEVRNRRRLTLSKVDGLAAALEESQGARPATRISPLKPGKESKLEEIINIEALDRLKEAFARADKDGQRKLTETQFQGVLREALRMRNQHEDQIRTLFMKIDSSSDGKITWDEFCTYMQLEYAEKEDSYTRAKEVAFHLPARMQPSPHREPCLRITHLPDSSFVGISQDGVVSFWSSSLDHKRTRTIQTPGDTSLKKPKWITDFVLMPQYNKFILGTGDREIQFFELSTFEPYCQISGLETVPLKLDYCATGIDECLIIFGDSDGCINIVVITSTGETLRTWKKMPKTEGLASVNIDSVASGSLTRFVRWKVHGDWVQDLRYYDEIRQVISCSNHSNTALVVGSIYGSTSVDTQMLRGGEATAASLLSGGASAGASLGATPASGSALGSAVTLSGASFGGSTSSGVGHKDEKVSSVLKVADASTSSGPGMFSKDAANRRSQAYAQTRLRLDSDQAIFRVYKGVKTFDYNKDKNLIVTGGMDRIVRIWNPYVPQRPTGMLRGHTAPIFYLFVAAEENRIFSISTDKCIKVWDISDQNCLLSIRPKAHKIRGDLHACHFSSQTRGLVIATDQISLLTLKLRYFKKTEVIISHKEPIHCCKYNASFKQVITCSDGSVVKIWDLETGQPIFEYGGAHGNSAITAMAFDNTGRRLITGGRDGRIHIWNFNNGHCLKTLEKEVNNDEITAVTYVEMNRNRYVIAVGWDRCINIYPDTSEEITSVQFPLKIWDDDKKHGHREDILSIAQCPPNLLATSSYDGEIIVWNIISGHIYCRLLSPHPQGYQHHSAGGAKSFGRESKNRKMLGKKTKGSATELLHEAVPISLPFDARQASNAVDQGLEWVAASLTRGAAIEATGGHESARLTSRQASRNGNTKSRRQSPDLDVRSEKVKSPKTAPVSRRPSFLSRNQSVNQDSDVPSLRAGFAMPGTRTAPVSRRASLDDADWKQPGTPMRQKSHDNKSKPVFLTETVWEDDDDDDEGADEGSSLAGLSDLKEETIEGTGHFDGGNLGDAGVAINNFFEGLNLKSEKVEGNELEEEVDRVPADGDLSINKLLFMKSRTSRKEAASLVASGPRGCIHFWNVFQGGSLMASYPGSFHAGASVDTMCLGADDTLLATGDNFGFVHLWNVDGYGAAGIESAPPELLNTWRAHIEGVTCLDLIENHNLLLTTSSDCTVRLWTLEGEYIGTFGQPDSWDIFDPKTYQHPMVPYDVLVDPLSLPSHKIIAKKTTIDRVIHGNEEDDSRSPSPQPASTNRPQLKVDDSTIAAEIAERRYAVADGKRLRHERNKPPKQDRGGPSEYQMLCCHTLAATPDVQAPAVIAESKRSDPLAMFEDTNYVATT